MNAKPLPYHYDAIMPDISEQTMRLHHDKHYVGYLNTLNTLIEGTQYADMPLELIVSNSIGTIFNNAAQVWNHEFYFDQFSAAPAKAPTGALLEAINHTFGTFENFKSRLEATAATHFGSGWIWLVSNDAGDLHLINGANAENPLRNNAAASICCNCSATLSGALKPILTLDLWEHAYYKDYDNLRAKAISAHFDAIDWDVISARY